MFLKNKYFNHIFQSSALVNIIDLYNKAVHQKKLLSLLRELGYVSLKNVKCIWRSPFELPYNFIAHFKATWLHLSATCNTTHVDDTINVTVTC